MAYEEGKDLASGTLVIGSRCFGSAVVVTLDKLDYEILVVERDPAQVRVFAGHFPFIEADTISMDTLGQFGAREFKVVVTGAGSSSESSALTTADPMDLGMPSIWTKAISRKYGRVLRRVDTHHVIYPEFDAGRRTAHFMGGRMIDCIKIEEGSFAVMKLRPPREVCGFAFEDLDLRGRYGVDTLGILRLGQPLEYAKAQARINSEGIIIVSGGARLLEYFANRL